MQESYVFRRNNKLGNEITHVLTDFPDPNSQELTKLTHWTGNTISIGKLEITKSRENNLTFPFHLRYLASPVLTLTGHRLTCPHSMSETTCTEHTIETASLEAALLKTFIYSSEAFQLNSVHPGVNLVHFSYAQILGFLLILVRTF